MAPASPRRKGLSRLMQIGGCVLISAIASFPISFVVTMLLTPVLWRLEPVLGIELAGHSGPADWIFATIFGISTILLLAAMLWATRRAGRASGTKAGVESARPGEA